MTVFGVWSWTWFLGVVLFMPAAGMLGHRWWKLGRSGRFSQMSMAMIRAFLTNVPPEGSAWSSIRIAKLMLLGGAISMVSVVVGDAQASAPCESACEADGWKDGRWRGNPHVPVSQSQGRSCWCVSEGAWSETPISEDRVGPAPTDLPPWMETEGSR